MKRKANKLISGLEFWRRKKRVSKAELQELLGGAGNLQNWADPQTLLEASSIRQLILLADHLGVTVDELFKVHSTAQLEDGDRYQHQSKYNFSDNCLCNYRTAKGLNYRQLAERMGGISHQWAHQMCRSPRASRAGIRRIARYEKMTPEEFLSIYGGNAEHVNN